MATDVAFTNATPQINWLKNKASDKNTIKDQGEAPKMGVYPQLSGLQKPNKCSTKLP